MDEKELIKKIAEAYDERNYHVKYTEYAKLKSNEETGELVDSLYAEEGSTDFAITIKPIPPDKSNKMFQRAKGEVYIQLRKHSPNEIDVFALGKMIIEKYLKGWTGLDGKFLKSKIHGMKDVNDHEMIQYSENMALTLLSYMPQFVGFIIHAGTAFERIEEQIQDEQKKIS